MTFKQIVKELSKATTAEEVQEAMGAIDRSFEKGKITWNDHETLYALASTLWRCANSVGHAWAMWACFNK